MTDRELHFLRVLGDLEERISSDNPYVVLGASALMRQLLLDAAPLVDQVNQAHRIQLRFEVGLPRLAIDEHTVAFAMLDGIDPETSSGKRAQMTRDQFLGATVLAANGRRFTVRDIILFEANIMGGVHAGALKTEKDEALNKIASFLHWNDMRATLGELRAIGRVISRGLAPLKESIAKGST